MSESNYKFEHVLKKSNKGRTPTSSHCNVLTYDDNDIKKIVAKVDRVEFIDYFNKCTDIQSIDCLVPTNSEKNYYTVKKDCYFRDWCTYWGVAFGIKLDDIQSGTKEDKGAHIERFDMLDDDLKSLLAEVYSLLAV